MRAEAISWQQLFRADEFKNSYVFMSSSKWFASFMVEKIEIYGANRKIPSSCIYVTENLHYFAMIE